MTGRYITPDPIGLAGGINPFIYAGNDPVNFLDPYGLARYFVSYNITSYRPVIVPVGVSKISGYIISTTPNSDGTYTGTKFEGRLKGLALGSLPWSTTVVNNEYFEDCYKNADVNRINGKASYFSGAIAGGPFGVSAGTYKFGDMFGTKKTPSKAQGLDLGIDAFEGETWTVGSPILFSEGVFPKDN